MNWYVQPDVCVLRGHEGRQVPRQPKASDGVHAKQHLPFFSQAFDDRRVLKGELHQPGVCTGGNRERADGGKRHSPLEHSDSAVEVRMPVDASASKRRTFDSEGELADVGRHRCFGRPATRRAIEFRQAGVDRLAKYSAPEGHVRKWATIGCGLRAGPYHG